MARITGAHSIIYSTDAAADRAFLRDVMTFPHVDVGDGWLIFGLPPAEVAVHPGEVNDLHEFYLMVDDVAGFVAEMTARGVVCTPAQSLGWGVLTSVTLPGGGKLGVYEPRHARPSATKVRQAPTKRPAAKSAKKAVKKSAARKSAPKKKAAKPKRGKPAARRRP